MKRKKLITLFTPVVLVVVLDQLSKWLVRNNAGLQDLTLIEGWLEFYYTQNPGMALGIDWISTPVISVIAIIATIGISFYILKDLKQASTSYLICMGLILGGALGNIIDRLFMGLIEGTGGVLEGHVVDFIHFSLEINDWAVFPYIFNIADVAISTAIISMLIFGKRVFNVELSEADTFDMNENIQEVDEEHPFESVMKEDEEKASGSETEKEPKE